MRNRPTGRLVWALLAAGPVCLIAWAVTAGVWWSLGALSSGCGWSSRRFGQANVKALAQSSQAACGYLPRPEHALDALLAYGVFVGFSRHRG